MSVIGRAAVNQASGAQALRAAAQKARRRSPSIAEKSMKTSGTSTAPPIALQTVNPRDSAPPMPSVRNNGVVTLPIATKTGEPGGCG